MRLLAALLLLLPVIARGASYEYAVTFDTGSGKKSINALWNVTQDRDMNVIREVTAGLTQTVKAGADLSTKEWEMTARTEKGEDVAIRAVRDGNRIRVSGTLKGSAYSKVFEIDDKPWYQAVDMQMKAFIDSGGEDLEYWMAGMTPEFNVFKMTFKKKAVETINVLGRETECVKLEWRASGFWSLFWFSDYWFRKSDGIAVRFEMPGGGKPKAVSLLVSEKKR